jgi:ABC-type multidrug transport system fused ATPase/permease subunit
MSDYFPDKILAQYQPKSKLGKLGQKGFSTGQFFQAPRWWLLIAAGTLLMIFWNGQLVLATMAGVVVMLLVYLWLDGDLSKYFSQLQGFFKSKHSSLFIAVISGAIAALLSYIAIAICLESDSLPIALATIIQGLGTLVIIMLLSWQIIHNKNAGDHRNFHDLLNNLTLDNSLKRLVAVRQLINLLVNKKMSIQQQQALADAFRLMLTQEQEPLIRDALLSGLQTLNNYQLKSSI